MKVSGDQSLDRRPILLDKGAIASPRDELRIVIALKSHADLLSRVT